MNAHRRDPADVVSLDAGALPGAPSGKGDSSDEEWSMSPQTVSTPTAAARERPYAWVILLAVYLVSLAAPLNQLKVPPIMLKMCEAFDMDLGDGGLFMSVFSIAGCLLAIPSGLIIQRFGLKATGLLAAGSVFAGALVGALAGTTAMLFLGRLIEGTGMVLVMVMAPAAIALWFPANRRGIPMGLWATCVGIATITMYNLAPALTASCGLKSVWWLGTVVAGAACLLFALLFRSPGPEERMGEPPPARAGGTEVSLMAVMANQRLWMISLQFLCFNLIFMAFSTFYPAFLQEVRHYSEARAAFMASLIMILSIFAGPLAGFMTDRYWKRRYWMLSAWAVAAVLYAFPFSVTGWMVPALMAAIGIATAPIVPASFASIPEIVGSPGLSGMGMAVMALGQNAGMLIGPWAFGISVENLDWWLSGCMLIPCFIVAFIATWIVKVR